MENNYTLVDDHRDDSVDEQIKKCLNLEKPKSFFLFAGAGSGKTRSLIKSLNYLDEMYGMRLLKQGRQIAVITYTNAACDEIKRRASYNQLFSISTIHSFAWGLVNTYTIDIKQWLTRELTERKADLESKQATGHKTSQAHMDRARKIALYEKRLECLPNVKKFIYSPDGNNTEKNSLDHSEVIKMTAEFISTKPLLQSILVDRYPIMLIDESQDTKKELLDAFLLVQSGHSDKFSLGLIGDTMQRIYLDGKENLQSLIPQDWERPRKVMNHRCQKRIVDLCNSLRENTDGIQQEPRHDKQNGIIRVFITNCNNAVVTEQDVRARMADITGDSEWNNDVKCMTVEHHMAAKRLGFDKFFEPINNESSYKQGLMNGTLSVIGVFTHVLLPLYNAYIMNDRFDIMRIIRENSTVFKNKKKTMNLNASDINLVKEAVDNLLSLWNGNDPKCIDLLKCIYSNHLFDISSDLNVLMQRSLDETTEDQESRRINSLATALDAPFSEVIKYSKYIAGQASFDTHQGVKGLEFPRVMVIIDDEAAHGSTFNYNKLFGVEEKSSGDLQNEQLGKETTLDRTKRLLYVTCSRASESLAIVYYCTDINETREAIISSGWFSKDEIICWESH